MSENSSIVDNHSVRETDESRHIRAELCLSNHWEILSKTVDCHVNEYSDEHPDAPIRKSDDPQSWKDECLGKVTIELRLRRRRLYRCPHCGHLCHAHEYVDREYIHVPEMGHDVVLKVNVPKLKCDKCGRTPQIRFPLARPRVSYTKEVEKSVLRLLCSNTISATAKFLHIGAWVVSDILMYHVEHSLPEQDLSGVTTIFIDETQLRKGHDYVTVFSDINHRIIFITEGKGIDALERFCTHLMIQGGDPDNIRVVSADMSSTFEAGVLSYFRNATLVWDRFHLVQAINKDLNDVRKRTLKRRKGEPLRHVKYTVLKRPQNLNEKDEERLKDIRLNNLELALAYDMKEGFCSILENTDMYEAQAEFEEWYAWVMSCGCPEMVKRAEIFLLKANRILAWFDHRVNNGVAEGINSKIQKTKSAAYGYSNIVNFSAMCLYRYGDLVVAF